MRLATVTSPFCSVSADTSVEILASPALAEPVMLTAPFRSLKLPEREVSALLALASASARLRPWDEMVIEAPESDWGFCDSEGAEETPGSVFPAVAVAVAENPIELAPRATPSVVERSIS